MLARLVIAVAMTAAMLALLDMARGSASVETDRADVSGVHGSLSDAPTGSPYASLRP